MSDSVAAAGLLAAMGSMWLIYLAVVVVMIVALWKVFDKAGEPGWAAIVPLYNTYVLFKITFGQGWMFLLLCVPIANVIFGILVYVKLAKAFGKSTGFAVGLIFLPFIFTLILGFGESSYQGVPA